MLVLLLGSNIGNFDTPAAHAFLRRIRATVSPGDFLLLGADLAKPERELLLAYDDPLGVTAAFNKNLLVRINNELGGDFDLEAFDHVAVWNGADQRIEMHLVSRFAQTVRVAAAEMTVPFEAGERIWTESSYKYEPEQILGMGADAGFASQEPVDRRRRRLRTDAVRGGVGGVRSCSCTSVRKGDARTTSDPYAARRLLSAPPPGRRRAPPAPSRSRAPQTRGSSFSTPSH